MKNILIAMATILTGGIFGLVYVLVYGTAKWRREKAVKEFGEASIKMYNASNEFNKIPENYKNQFYEYNRIAKNYDAAYERAVN